MLEFTHTCIPNMIEYWLRQETRLLENQIGFILGRSALETIFLLRCLMKLYKEA